MYRDSRVKRLAAGAATLTLCSAALAISTGAGSAGALPRPGTATPIQHLVVIYQENVSFDHYFGTYPVAANSSGQPFTARPGTPSVDGLTGALLTANPNGVNPRRYDPANVNDVLTRDQDHNYNDEQRAFDGGKMDQFPQTVGNGNGKSPEGANCVAGDVMNYYDGDAVTALWNYAQRYAMSDNSYSSTFGPSSPGAINLASGDTGGVDMTHTANSPSIATATSPNADLTPDGQGGFSLTSDAQPYWDDCSTRDAVALSGKNIGDELNDSRTVLGLVPGRVPADDDVRRRRRRHRPRRPVHRHVHPGRVQGRSSTVRAALLHQGICNAVPPLGAGSDRTAAAGTGQYGYKDDYIPHHQPFDYYASTANPHHLTVPTNGSVARAAPRAAHHRHATPSTRSTGMPQFDTPNHQYDMSDFDQLVPRSAEVSLPPSALPAVSFLKAPGYQDGHAVYSDPIDEQEFLVNEINALQKTPDWKSTAVVIAYDDSDGWYDHAFPA